MYFGDNNYFEYNHLELKEILNKLEEVVEEEKALELYNQIYNIYLEDLPFIGICRNTRHLITTLRFTYGYCS